MLTQDTQHPTSPSAYSVLWLQFWKAIEILSRIFYFQSGSGVRLLIDEIGVTFLTYGGLVEGGGGVKRDTKWQRLGELTHCVIPCGKDVWRFIDHAWGQCGWILTKFFFSLLWTVRSRTIFKQKRTKPKSSHLDRTSLVIREIKQRRFWATHVNRKRHLFHFKINWQYQICLSWSLSYYRDDLSKNLGKNTTQE